MVHLKHHKLHGSTRLRFLVACILLLLVGILTTNLSSRAYFVSTEFYCSTLAADQFSRCNAFEKLEPSFVCKSAREALIQMTPEARRRIQRVKDIPHHIHQSWKDSDLPKKFQHWSSSWIESHPHWQYHLWTDSNNRQLVEHHYPQFLQGYDALPREIMRADVIRNMYLHHYGGVYADLDTWSLRNSGNITGKVGAVVAEMGTDTTYEHNIPNAWMASAQGHPLWYFIAHLVLNDPSWWQGQEGRIEPEDVTGPVVLKYAVDTWRCMGYPYPITVLPAGYVFVMDWHNNSDHARFERSCNRTIINTGKGRSDCFAEYPNAHVLTFWAHSWGK